MASHTANASLIVNPRLRAYRQRGQTADAEIEVNISGETRKVQHHKRTASLFVTIPQMRPNKPQVRTR